MPTKNDDLGNTPLQNAERHDGLTTQSWTHPSGTDIALHTISLISTPMAVLPARLGLRLARGARAGISRVGILRRFRGQLALLERPVSE